MRSYVPGSRRAVALALSLLAMACERSADRFGDEGDSARALSGGAARDSAPPLRSPDVIYVPTPPNVVRQMIELTRIGANDTLFDLGSGDGRIVIEAARRGARAIGIDIDAKRIAESWRNAESAGMTDEVEFRQADLFETDLRSATAVTLYLLPTLNVKLRPKLFDELRPGTPVVSHNFPMADWIPDSTLEMRGSTVFLWYVPADVAGRWEVEASEEANVGWEALRLEQQFQSISGAAVIAGRELRLARTRLRGKGFTFEVTDSSGTRPLTSRFSGEVRGDSIIGVVTAAGRRQGTPVRALRRR